VHTLTQGPQECDPRAGPMCNREEILYKGHGPGRRACITVHSHSQSLVLVAVCMLTVDQGWPSTFCVTLKAV
jgi:hypothetical protein